MSFTEPERQLTDEEHSLRDAAGIQPGREEMVRALAWQTDAMLAVAGDLVHLTHDGVLETLQDAELVAFMAAATRSLEQLTRLRADMSRRLFGDAA